MWKKFLRKAQKQDKSESEKGISESFEKKERILFFVSPNEPLTKRYNAFFSSKSSLNPLIFALYPLASFLFFSFIFLKKNLQNFLTSRRLELDNNKKCWQKKVNLPLSIISEQAKRVYFFWNKWKAKWTGKRAEVTRS